MEELLDVIALANPLEVEDLILHQLLDLGGNNLNADINFDLNAMSEDDVRTHFRFEKNGIRQLLHILRIPNEIRTYTRNRISGEVALCILLKRLAYPNRLSDLTLMFGLSPQSLSQIANHVMNIIISEHGHLLEDLQNNHWLNRARLQYYAEAVYAKGGALQNCWSFIDGTTRAICRPSIDQEEYYSGHKRHHCIKYQSVLCPDGIIVSLKGGFPGRRHDAGIFRDSNLYRELEMVTQFEDRTNYVVYGDQAYGIMELLCCPYPTRPIMPLHQREFNNSMQVLRIAVEWGFHKIISLFAFLDFKKNQKLLLQDVETMYKVGTILTNCHTCMYGCQTAEYFNVLPPTLEQYIGV